MIKRIHFVGLPLSNEIVNIAAKTIPARSEPIIKPRRQALHLGEQMLLNKRLKQEDSRNKSCVNEIFNMINLLKKICFSSC
jgi:hypothetical protein